MFSKPRDPVEAEHQQPVDPPLSALTLAELKAYSDELTKDLRPVQVKSFKC